MGRRIKAKRRGSKFLSSTPAERPISYLKMKCTSCGGCTVLKARPKPPPLIGKPRGLPFVCKHCSARCDGASLKQMLYFPSSGKLVRDVKRDARRRREQMLRDARASGQDVYVNPDHLD
jgi:hypothetical protein